MNEPIVKRAVLFVDGQNFFHSVKHAFKYSFPNFDLLRLSDQLCTANGWRREKICFYTGVPPAKENQFWHEFWSNKTASMKRQGIGIFTRALRYSDEDVVDDHGNVIRARVPREKGIDVRIALDVVREARQGDLDVALILSRDQDLSEVAEDVRAIAKEQRRWIKIASAFPETIDPSNNKGIYKTDWIPIPRSMYDLCIDSNDYRPKKKKP